MPRSNNNAVELSAVGGGGDGDFAYQAMSDTPVTLPQIPKQ